MECLSSSDASDPRAKINRINLTRVRTAFRARGILGMAALTTLAARDIVIMI